MVNPLWDSEHVEKVDTPSSSDSQFGNAFNTSFLDFEFDTGFIGTHQQMLTDSFNANGYNRRPSLLENKTYGTIVDVDRYMVGQQLSIVATRIDNGDKVMMESIALDMFGHNTDGLSLLRVVILGYVGYEHGSRASNVNEHRWSAPIHPSEWCSTL